MAATDPRHEAKREAFDLACDGIAQGHEERKRDMGDIGAMKTMSTQTKSAKKSKKLPAGHPHKCTAHKDEAGKFGVWICTDAKCDRFPTKLCPDCDAKNPLKMPKVPDPTSNNLGEVLGLKPDLPQGSNVPVDSAADDETAQSPKDAKKRASRKTKTVLVTETDPEGEATVAVPPATPAPHKGPAGTKAAYVTLAGVRITLAAMPAPNNEYFPHLDLWQGQKWMYTVRVGEAYPTREKAREFASQVREQYRANGSIPARPEPKAKTPRTPKSRWDRMTDEQIQELIEQAQAELTRRQERAEPQETQVKQPTQSDAA